MLKANRAILEVRVLKLKLRIKASWLKYFRKNLGAPFIISFQALLLVCAGLLIHGNSGLANEVAVYAYYLLVIGVVLQLASFLKYGKRHETSE